MPSVCGLERIERADLPGVEMFPLSPRLERGRPQEIIVRIAPHAEIPLHTHEVDARMVVVAGEGTVLATDETDGTSVSPGIEVFFERGAPHGFRAGPAGMTFLTFNGGIVARRSADWDMEFVAE